MRLSKEKRLSTSAIVGLRARGHLKYDTSAWRTLAHNLNWSATHNPPLALLPWGRATELQYRQVSASVQPCLSAPTQTPSPLLKPWINFVQGSFTASSRTLPIRHMALGGAGHDQIDMWVWSYPVVYPGVRGHIPFMAWCSPMQYLEIGMQTPICPSIPWRPHFRSE